MSDSRIPSPCEFVSVSRAARAYPKRDADVRRMLRERGLVNEDGLVLWGQVVTALRARGSASAVVHRPSGVTSTGGGVDEQDMDRKWPRTITVDVVDGTQVRAQPMKGRGKRGDGRVYWKVRRYPGQAGFSVASHTASGSGWATRSELIQAINAALVAELGDRDVPGVEPFGAMVTGPDASMTIAELVEQFLDKRERFDNLRPRTIRQYRHAQKVIGEYLGQLRAADLTTTHLERFATRVMKDRGRRGKSLSTQGVRNMFSVLRPAMRWAVETQRIPLTKEPKFPRLAYEPTKKSRPPERAVLRATFAWLAEDRPAVGRALRLQALTGVRVGELWSMRWRDVHRQMVSAAPGLPAREVVSVEVRGKTGRRRVPLSPAAVKHVEMLQDLYGGRRADHVIGNLAGRNSEQLSSRINDAFERVPWHTIGPRWRPNDLRSLFGNELIRTGISPPDYEAIMGHSFAVGMQSYLEARSDDMHRAVERMDVVSHLDVDITPLRGARGDE